MAYYLSWVANAVLFVAACFLAADTANAVFASLLSEETVQAAPRNAPTPRAAGGSAWRDRQVIVTRNLFNASSAEEGAEAEISEDLEETKLPLKLLGTTAAEDPTFSWAAVMNEQRRETVVVTLGDELFEGKASVLRIERRRIVLSEDGENRELTFGDEPPQQRSVARRGAQRPPRRNPRAERRSAIRKLAENRFALPREEVERAIADPTDILSQARFLPKYEGDEMLGFQVNGIKKDSILREFGLKDGDLITEFNGVAINSPTETARLMKEFNESSEVTIRYVDADGNEQVANIGLD